MRRILSYFVLVWLGSTVSAQTIVSIHTRETLLKLQEGREAPRLVSLKSGPSRIWSNGISRAIDPARPVPRRSRNRLSSLAEPIRVT